MGNRKAIAKEQLIMPHSLFTQNVYLFTGISRYMMEWYLSDCAKCSISFITSDNTQEGQRQDAHWIDAIEFPSRCSEVLI